MTNNTTFSATVLFINQVNFYAYEKEISINGYFCYYSYYVC